MKYYSIHEFSKLIGRTPQTLRNWDASNRLKPHHTGANGYRYYSHQQLNEILGVADKPRKIIGYCRVSSNKQKDDLERQVENMHKYLSSIECEYEIIQDIGSGINYTKKGLRNLLQRINNKEVSKNVVFYKDRLLRFGFELVTGGHGYVSSLMNFLCDAKPRDMMGKNVRICLENNFTAKHPYNIIINHFLQNLFASGAEREKWSVSMFNNKTLLITGGTGSFGNAVLDRFLQTNIKEIRIFSRDEKKQDDMRNTYKNNKIKFYIGDVRDLSGIQFAMRDVDYVFHAAALKQVPSCEFFPLEAVKTNIIGTDNVLTAAINAEVKKVICLSTDKAAYPINAMGISKAMMEKVFVAKSRDVNPDKTIICGTRYGNVMCSRGSVIPLFIEQIKSGIPITITNPDMTRFLMSLDEAVELVLFAFKNATNGDILVQKAPACTIGVLAQAIKELFNAQVETKIIGIRHGEKMYETLLTKEECVNAIDMGNYYKIPADNRDLNYGKYFDIGTKDGLTLKEFNSDNTTLLTIEETKNKLLSNRYVKSELASRMQCV